MEKKKIRYGALVICIRAVVFVCKPFYKLLFGWLDLSLSDKNTQRLVDDIHASTEFASLLEMYGGMILPPEPNRQPNGFDYGIVIIKFENIQLRIVRGRGELDVDLASMFESDRKPWWNLTSVWLAVASADWPTPPSIYDSPDQYAYFLKTYWNPLVSAFSSQHSPKTKEKLLKNFYRQIPEQMELRKLSLHEKLKILSSDPL